MPGAESERGSTDTGGGSWLDAAPRVGRRVGVATFWVVALYAAAAGFYSIPAQVFAVDPPTQAHATSCGAGIRSLRASLLAHGSEQVGRGGATDERARRESRARFEAWDAEHRALGASCAGSGAAAHEALGRMRHRMESMLRRFDGEQAPLRRAVDDGLRSLTHDRQRDLD